MTCRHGTADTQWPRLNWEGLKPGSLAPGSTLPLEATPPLFRETVFAQRGKESVVSLTRVWSGTPQAGVRCVYRIRPDSVNRARRPRVPCFPSCLFSRPMSQPREPCHHSVGSGYISKAGCQPWPMPRRRSCLCHPLRRWSHLEGRCSDAAVTEALGRRHCVEERPHGEAARRPGPGEASGCERALPGPSGPAHLQLEAARRAIPAEAAWSPPAQSPGTSCTLLGSRLKASRRLRCSNGEPTRRPRALAAHVRPRAVSAPLPSRY